MKLAMTTSGFTNRKLSRQTGILENRIARIKNGWQTALPDEQRLIANCLRRPRHELFPAEHAPPRL